MRVVKLLPSLALLLISSLAIADDKNCSDLSDRQARQECMKRSAGADVDCSTINEPQARRECAERKQQNSADCSKLETAEMRQRCMRQKAD
jgi:hypothetical protein